MNLSKLMGHQKSCNQTPECQLNGLLLEYFIQSELNKEPETKCDEVEIGKLADKVTEEEKSEGSSKVQDGVKTASAKVMKITNCPHTTRKHYAKVPHLSNP
jgi:hypothetical protein